MLIGVTGLYITFVEKEFIETLRDHLMTQHINTPTKARATDNPHIWDHVLSNARVRSLWILHVMTHNVIFLNYT